MSLLFLQRRTKWKASVFVFVFVFLIYLREINLYFVDSNIQFKRLHLEWDFIVLYEIHLINTSSQVNKKNLNI